MHFFSINFLHSQPLHVSSRRAAHHQEERLCINSIWYSHALCWLAAGRVGMELHPDPASSQSNVICALCMREDIHLTQRLLLVFYGDRNLAHLRWTLLAFELPPWAADTNLYLTLVSPKIAPPPGVPLRQGPLSVIFVSSGGKNIKLIQILYYL